MTSPSLLAWPSNVFIYVCYGAAVSNDYYYFILLDCLHKVWLKPLPSNTPTIVISLLVKIQNDFTYLVLPLNTQVVMEKDF